MALEDAAEDDGSQRLVDLQGRARDPDADVPRVIRLRAAGQDRAQPSPEVKADRDPRVGRRFPQHLPRLVPKRYRHLGREQHPSAEPGLLEVAHLLSGHRRVVDWDQAHTDQALGRGGAELREPVVVGAVAYTTNIGILDQERDDRAVHDRRVDAVPVHVRQAQRRRRRAEHTVLEHAATVDRGPASAPGAGRSGTPAPELPPVVPAHPGRAIARLHDLRGPVAPLRRHARVPDILRHPLQVDVIVGRDDPVVHGVLRIQCW